MTVSRPPRVTRSIVRPPQRAFPFENDQLLLLAVAVLLWQEGASVMLVLALLYIAM